MKASKSGIKSVISNEEEEKDDSASLRLPNEFTASELFPLRSHPVKLS